MNKILEKYSKVEIASICGVTLRTVYNWFNLSTMPISAIEKLGFKVVEK